MLKLLIFATLVLGILWLPSTFASGKVALVIGTSEYADKPLKNPVNDAEDMTKLLKQYGFSVTNVTNADHRSLDTAIGEFGNKLKNADIGLFFYAGHGMQVNGQNYLIPVDSQINTEADIQWKSVNVGQILSQMEHGATKLNIIILDACRDNPFKRSFSRSSATRGLSRIAETPTGTILVYAAAPGQTASDGDGRNGIFTQHFLQNIKPGSELVDVLKQTSRGVYESTDQKQEPYLEMSGLADDFYFIPPQVQSQMSTAELSAWQSIRDSHDTQKLKAFLRRFPNSIFALVVRSRINNRSPEQLPLFVDSNPAGAKIRVLNIQPAYQYGMKLKPGRYHLEASKAGYVRNREWVNLGATQQSFILSLDLDSGRGNQTTTRKFSESVKGVEFVMKPIPGGIFNFGSTAGDRDERPQIPVKISPFYMAEIETTWELYQLCIDEGVCPNNQEAGGDEGFGKDKRPVINVSYEDLTQHFFPWLTAKTNKPYRLPSEAEWEYAARAGSNSTYSWGDKPSGSKANGGQNKGWPSDNFLNTAPVKSFPANGFGLHDMLGNVWEWTKDCYTKNHLDHPKTSGPSFAAKCWDKRVMRGGSWYDSPSSLRSANRFGADVDHRGRSGGFRIALSDYSEPEAGSEKYNRNSDFVEALGERSFKMNKLPSGKVKIEAQSLKQSFDVSSFYLGETEVTVALYRYFVKQTGYKPDDKCKMFSFTSLAHENTPGWHAPGFEQTENSPVVCVNFKDITRYFLPWLNKNTGKKYRLANSVEWAYAAKAGNDQTFSWGNDIDCSHANFGSVSTGGATAYDNCPSRKTLPVKSYRANRFGLFNMVGNAKEWVMHCFSDTLKIKKCKYGALTGGDFLTESHVLEPTRIFDYKSSHIESSRRYNFGFRLALDM
jgi:formylglycine-generating enzyme required for sulfatase activity